VDWTTSLAVLCWTKKTAVITFFLIGMYVYHTNAYLCMNQKVCMACNFTTVSKLKEGHCCRMHCKSDNMVQDGDVTNVLQSTDH